MSRTPHFSSNAKAERELGYEVTPIDDAIRDAGHDFAARGLVPAPSVHEAVPIRDPQRDEAYGHR